MTQDVKIIFEDSSLSPNEITLELAATSIKGNADRDIKIFDIGVMAFIVEDILSGYKLPNYITDWGRHKEKISIEGEIIEGVHDPILDTLWTLRKRLLLDSFRYKKNYLEIGDEITEDSISSESSGTGPIYCRVKNFDWQYMADELGYISYGIELWVGKIIRIID